MGQFSVEKLALPGQLSVEINTERNRRDALAGIKSESPAGLRRNSHFGARITIFGARSPASR
jgi:hypothetical protein